MSSFQKPFAHHEVGEVGKPVRHEIEVDGLCTTYEILTPGAGRTVQKGVGVTVHATGVIKESGRQFWCTKESDQPFSYDAGVGAVIIGWDQGCMGMAIGETRRLTIPADEAYGSAGFATWGIPPHATLEFTIELLTIGCKRAATDFSMSGAVRSLSTTQSAPTKASLPIPCAPAPIPTTQPQICAANAWHQHPSQ